MCKEVSTKHIYEMKAEFMQTYICVCIALYLYGDKNVKWYNFSRLTNHLKAIAVLPDLISYTLLLEARYLLVSMSVAQKYFFKSYSLHTDDLN